jgi:hypothetical protein
VWKRPLGCGNHQERKQNMSTPSPVTDGERIWVMTGTGILKAFDFSGAEIWKRDIQKDYGRFGLNWGYGSSPLLYQDSLFVQVLHGMRTDDPSYVLRIDKATGKTLWRVERPTNARMESPDSYTTPALLKYGSATEIVITGGDVVTGHDLASGKELWRANGLNPDNDANYRIVASPVVHGELIIAPTRERPMLVLKAGGRGDVTKSHLSVVVRQRSRRADSRHRRSVSLRDQRSRHHVVPRPAHRQGDLRAPAAVARYLQRFTSAGGRQDLHHERRRCHQRRQGGSDVRACSRRTISTITRSARRRSPKDRSFIRTQKHLYCIGKRAAR